jgi:predicted metal-dependent phosphoesterase TrpH
MGNHDCSKITMMFRIEFHCHTIYSKDSLTPLFLLVETCRQKGIDRVVITDHNTISGAQAAQALDPERVIVGEEIMTTKGEILAAYVKDEVPPSLSPEETIKRLHDQGAFISVSHPFDAWRKGGWKEPDLMEIIPFVDAIEVYNSRCMLPSFNDRALDFAHRYNLAGTVGSDAHVAFELGRSVLMLEPFQNPDELRKVIRNAVSQTRWSPPWFHLSSRYANLRKKFTVLR